jgi:aryl-alcohol dehydrogenase-like predicted oxidoreductase
MKRMDRRHFIKTGIAGFAGFTVLQKGLAGEYLQLPPETMVDKVALGRSGLTVSRIAMGTGTAGGNKSSNFTRMGLENFVKIAHHAYERGIRFYDTADSYGTMPMTKEAIKSFPRENLTLLSKIWSQPDDTQNQLSVSAELDRFRKELGVEYIDIVLMHCLLEGGWGKTRTHYMDGLSKAKQAGIVKAVGVSCHNIDALAEAAVNPWVEVIMARINPFGTNMDGSPDDVKKILATARANGKGIIGMKIFGEGKHVQDDEREKSIRYAFKEGNVHCVTLGMESIEQMDDAIKRVMAK